MHSLINNSERQRRRRGAEDVISVPASSSALHPIRPVYLHRSHVDIHPTCRCKPLEAPSCPEFLFCKAMSHEPLPPCHSHLRSRGTRGAVEVLYCRKNSEATRIHMTCAKSGTAAIWSQLSRAISSPCTAIPCRYIRCACLACGLF